MPRRTRVTPEGKGEPKDPDAPQADVPAEEPSAQGTDAPRAARATRARAGSKKPSASAVETEPEAPKAAPARRAAGGAGTRAGSRRPSASAVEAEQEAPKAAPARRAAASTGDRASSRRGAATTTVVEPEATAPEVKAPEAPIREVHRLLLKYRQEAMPALVKEFDYTNPMDVPRVEKVTINIGLAEALQNPRSLENTTRDLTLIAGQRPVVTRARNSIAGFKLREGMAIGLKVTLRGRRMHDFLDKLVNAVLPRIRDFRGISRDSFDGRGNFSLGIREHIIFPEIDYNQIERIRGLQITVVTTAKTDQESIRLLELLGFPFVRVAAPVEATA